MHLNDRCRRFPDGRHEVGHDAEAPIVDICSLSIDARAAAAMAGLSILPEWLTGRGLSTICHRLGMANDANPSVS